MDARNRINVDQLSKFVDAPLYREIAREEKIHLFIGSDIRDGRNQHAMLAYLLSGNEPADKNGKRYYHNAIMSKSLESVAVCECPAFEGVTGYGLEKKLCQRLSLELAVKVQKNINGLAFVINYDGRGTFSSVKEKLFNLYQLFNGDFNRLFQSVVFVFLEQNSRENVVSLLNGVTDEDFDDFDNAEDLEEELPPSQRIDKIFFPKLLENPDSIFTLNCADQGESRKKLFDAMNNLPNKDYSALNFSSLYSGILPDSFNLKKFLDDTAKNITAPNADKSELGNGCAYDVARDFIYFSLACDSTKESLREAIIVILDKCIDNKNYQDIAIANLVALASNDERLQNDLKDIAGESSTAKSDIKLLAENIISNFATVKFKH